MKMKTFKILFFVGTFMLFLNGCNSNDNPYNQPVAGNTEFYDNAVSAFNQNEDDTPLEVTETVDETSNFDTLL